MDIFDLTDSIAPLTGAGVLLVVCILVLILSLLVAIAPLMCWLNLRGLRKQVEDLRRVIVHQFEQSVSLGQIAQSQPTIASAVSEPSAAPRQQARPAQPVAPEQSQPAAASTQPETPAASDRPAAPEQQAQPETPASPEQSAQPGSEDSFVHLWDDKTAE